MYWFLLKNACIWKKSNLKSVETQFFLGEGGGGAEM